MTHLLLACVIFCAFVVESSLGFGGTVIAVTLGVFFVPIDQLLPAFIPVNIALSSYLVLRYRRAIDWAVLLERILPPMTLGIPFGLAWYRYGNHQVSIVIFGVFVVALSSRELWRALRPAGTTRPLPLLGRVAALVAGGVMHGAFAVGGPMAVYVAGRDLPDKGAFRSTLSALWLTLNLMLLAGYLFSGDITGESATLSVLLGGPLIAGLATGDWLHRRANEHLFRVGVFSVLCVAGFVLALH